MHTHWSDGSGSITEMARAGLERGYEYIAITDHSKGLKIAGGIDELALARQGDEIDSWNKANQRTSFRVLRSIEVNLSPQGEGDMDPAALKRLDLVLGSFHSALRKKEDQTDRYLAALRNPEIQILGHPRGRIYNFRFGLKADWPRVFAEAAKRNKAVEVDCYPDRQDLSVEIAACGQTGRNLSRVRYRRPSSQAVGIHRARIGGSSQSRVCCGPDDQLPFPVRTPELERRDALPRVPGHAEACPSILAVDHRATIWVQGLTSHIG